MGFILNKKIGFLFFIFSAALLSTSSASRPLISMELNEVSVSHHKVVQELGSWEQLNHGEPNVHERLLTVRTNDYGTYDPAPTMTKPAFKLIPN